MEIGDRIKIRRAELGISQSELCKRMGYTNYSTISKIENGERSFPIERIGDFANALSCTKEWLMGWESEKSTLISTLEYYANRLPESRLNDLINMAEMWYNEEKRDVKQA